MDEFIGQFSQQPARPSQILQRLSLSIADCRPGDRAAVHTLTCGVNAMQAADLRDLDCPLPPAPCMILSIADLPCGVHRGERIIPDRAPDYNLAAVERVVHDCIDHAGVSRPMSA